MRSDGLTSSMKILSGDSAFGSTFITVGAVTTPLGALPTSPSPDGLAPIPPAGGFIEKGKVPKTADEGGSLIVRLKLLPGEKDRVDGETGLMSFDIVILFVSMLQSTSHIEVRSSKRGLVTPAM
jgi:hypothetical protein